ncbi:MAG: single-stranded DNA-binding protein [Polyangia bacterium]|jgi:single-strand selective monofunctional uracil DNA glycosylase|nr:single-stranded DNA-binding protein [Polyangia bacterium]
MREQSITTVSERLARAVDALAFAPPVHTVYNPLGYAWAPHAEYLRIYGQGQKEVLLLGMNPGPFGMVQTGVPFGDPRIVRDWLGIQCPVHRPPREHPKRPILGFESPRSEVSGSRLWGWARDTHGTPERFFARFFVTNYCPLAFLEESGKNRTPDKLPGPERQALWAACDEALVDLVGCLGVRYVIGVGKFAADRAREALGSHSVTIGSVLHPSPANPKANRGWAGQATAELAALGISL